MPPHITCQIGTVKIGLYDGVASSGSFFNFYLFIIIVICYEYNIEMLVFKVRPYSIVLCTFKNGQSLINAPIKNTVGSHLFRCFPFF